MIYRQLSLRWTNAVTDARFVVALALLIINDSILKQAIPGLVTGKLSDIAGLFIVGRMAVAALPHHRWKGLALVASVFVWWKSEASQSFIDLLTQHSIYVGRMVDVTDLWALLILPLCLRSAHNVQYLSRLRTSAAVLSTVVTTLAITATSSIGVRQDFAVASQQPITRADAGTVASIVAAIAKAHDLDQCNECRNSNEQIAYSGGGIHLSYTLLTKSKGIYFHLLGSRGNMPEVLRIRKDVETMLAQQMPSMAFAVDVDGSLRDEFGIGSGYKTFIFSPPPYFQGPYPTNPIAGQPQSFFRRQEGLVSWIDLWTVDEPVDAQGVEPSSLKCAGDALEGRNNGHAVVAREPAEGIVGGGTYGTLIRYTTERDGKTYRALLACLTQATFNVIIVFREPVSLPSSDAEGVLAAIRSMVFPAWTSEGPKDNRIKYPAG